MDERLCPTDWSQCSEKCALYFCGRCAVTAIGEMLSAIATVLAHWAGLLKEEDDIWPPQSPLSQAS